MENNNSVLHKISEREDPIDTEKMAYAELKAFEKDNLNNKRKRNNQHLKWPGFSMVPIYFVNFNICLLAMPVFFAEELNMARRRPIKCHPSITHVLYCREYRRTF